MTLFQSIQVEEVYQTYSEPSRTKLLELRELIMLSVKNLQQQGILGSDIEESLKWGQPSYTTVHGKVGSPIRLCTFGKENIAMLFHCQTSLIERFRVLFPNTLKFSKNRAIVLNPNEPIPTIELTFCIESALTYYIDTKRRGDHGNV